MPEHEITRIQEQVKTIFADLNELKCELKAEIKDLKSEVKELREMLANRLPLWATLFIGFLMAALGWSAGTMM